MPAAAAGGGASTPDVSDRSARLLGHVTIDNAAVPVNNSQVGGTAWSTSVAGVPDTMPRKRSGATGLSPNYTAFHITSNTTTTVTAATCYIQSIIVVVSGAGTAWTIKIQNREGTPKQYYPAVTAAVGTATPVNVVDPVLATSGIDIVTAGTTPGTVDVYVTYWQ